MESEIHTSAGTIVIRPMFPNGDQFFVSLPDGAGFPLSAEEAHSVGRALLEFAEDAGFDPDEGGEGF